jgi:hypothetical protein
MRQRVLVAITAALVAATAGGVAVSAHDDCAGPAGGFSAYYYQSPGGMRRAQRPETGRTAAAETKAVPYPESCGAGRTRRDGRCVRVRE